MSCINPYELLGVTINNTKKEIKQRYYDLSLFMHPDKGGSKDDMIILHNAYKFIINEIENINTTVTVEQLESEFKNFCMDQEKQVPKFQEIYADAFNLDLFNNKFNKAIHGIETELFKASLDGGYGELMDNSEINEMLSDLKYKDVIQGDVTNNFGAISVYSDTIKEQTFFNNVHDYTIKKVDNYSMDMNGLHMSDYKEAYTPIIYDSNIKSRTLDDIEKERTDLDDKLENTNFLSPYTWSFSGLLDENGKLANILKIEL